MSMLQAGKLGSPLHHALREDDQDLVKLLESYGATVAVEVIESIISRAFWEEFMEFGR